MKAWLVVLAWTAAVGLQSAAAEPRGFGFSLQAQGQRGQQRDGMQREHREMRREQQRPEPGRSERRYERLSDEERRDLRRDIDQANRDIYRPNRGR